MAANGREWMYQRTDTDRYMNSAFMAGVNEFLQFAFSGKESEMIKCPCRKCNNRFYRIELKVREHLFRYGFTPNYYIWHCHNEQYDSNLHNFSMTRSCFPSQLYGGISGESSSVNAYEQMVCESMGPLSSNVGSGNSERMLVDEEFIDADVEEPDNGSDNNDNVFDVSEMREGLPNPTAQQFYNLLDDANAPLWDGCTKQTRLSAMTQLLSCKSEFNMTDRCFDRVLELMKEMLPESNRLSSTLYDAKQLTKGLGLPYIKIHACENNCMLFYREDEKLTHCRECGSSRYKERVTSGRKTLILKKLLRYLPITSRLKRLYMSSKTATHMTWHAYNKSCNDGSMGHPCQSEAWRHVDRTFPSFADEIRNVRLGLCTDGFNPNNVVGGTYTIWPIFIVVYNLPPELCMKEPFIFMTLLIPGPRAPGCNIDAFLRPLIEELKTLWSEGVVTWDSCRQQNFVMKACLLWTINDFPALGNLSGWSTHGKLACPYCMDEIDTFMLKKCRKPCWFDCHRVFLPHNHTFRSNVTSFIPGKKVSAVASPYKSGEEIHAMLVGYCFPPFGSSYDKHRVAGFGEWHNWLKRSIFWELPYWKHLLVRHNLDVMHIEKNCFENIFNIVMDIRGKTKDNSNSRLSLQELKNMRRELHLRNIRGKCVKPKASYTLSREHIRDVTLWLKTIKMPDGYASNLGRTVNLSDGTFYNFKSHDCHVLMQRLLPIALRGYMPGPIWETISEFCSFFRTLCTSRIRFDDIQQLERNIVVTICKLEKIFPPAFFDSMEHLVIHLPHEAKLCGPVQFRWMYPFER